MVYVYILVEVSIYICLLPLTCICKNLEGPVHNWRSCFFFIILSTNLINQRYKVILKKDNYFQTDCMAELQNARDEMENEQEKKEEI